MFKPPGLLVKEALVRQISHTDSKPPQVAAPFKQQNSLS